MTDKDKKELMANQMLEKLDSAFTERSQLYLIAKKGLMKLNWVELNALDVMIYTSRRLSPLDT